MPLDEPAIASSINSLIIDTSSKPPEEAVEALKDGLAKIIVDAIKSATVTVDAGIAVSTTGTASAQTGTTTATGTGSLS